MISVERLRKRKSHFRVNDWILDSGAFSQISRHGCFSMSSTDYLKQVERWKECGRLVAACTQDWMCEDFVLARTGKSIEEHQHLTVLSYEFLSRHSSVYILPILQGFKPSDYVRHLSEYGSLLAPCAWTGLGSVCRRNGNPDAIEDILLAIKSHRGDLRLHGFGLKIQALERPTIRALLESSDSMAWSHAGRHDEMKPGTNLADDPRMALRYAAQIEQIIKRPVFIQDQLFGWWS
jgi:hypothetical protein